MLSGEIFEIFKDTYFEEHPGTTASEKPEAAVQMCSLESCSRKLIEIFTVKFQPSACNFT